jgi:hypothetical protein
MGPWAGRPQPSPLEPGCRPVARRDLAAWDPNVLAGKEDRPCPSGLRRRMLAEETQVQGGSPWLAQ